MAPLQFKYTEHEYYRGTGDNTYWESEVLEVCVMDCLCEVTVRALGETTLFIQEVYDPTSAHLNQIWGEGVQG